MKVAALLALACVGLAGCATPVKRIAAANPKLAAVGWQQAAAPIPIRGIGISANRTLVCLSDTCGGPAVVMAGGGPLDTSTSFGHVMQTTLTTPSLDSSALRQGASLNSLRQRAGSEINIENIEKTGKELHVVANGMIPIKGSMSTMLMHITVTLSSVSFEATAGADRAKAQSLFSMVPLAR
jgi:hypothetical protein